MAAIKYVITEKTTTPSHNDLQAPFLKLQCRGLPQVTQEC